MIQTATHFGEKFPMSMSITNSTISTKAPANTAIGNLALFDASANSLNARFLLTQNSAGMFYLSGSSLLTERASIAPGYYSVRVDGVGQTTRWSEKGFFTIQVTST
jgi:hypothetical protein